MAGKGDRKDAATSGAAGTESEHRVQLGIRLQAANHSDQPVFSNFSAVRAAPGMVFLDFGFLEPGALPSVIRTAQSGGKLPEAVNGRLAARVVMGLDAAAQLAQQLDQQLRAISASMKQAGHTAPVGAVSEAQH